MIDALRPNEEPFDDPKELSTARPADGVDEPAIDEKRDFALQAVDPPKETASGFTSRHPYGTARRSTHIF